MVLTLYTSKQFSFQPVMSNADNVKKFSNNEYIFELFGNMFHILVSGCQLEYRIFQSGLKFVNLKCRILNTCFDSFHCVCLEKTTTNIRYSKFKIP